MISLTRNELVGALKKFKSMAKQDILSASSTSDPNYWKEHAEARRQEYYNLIEIVEIKSIEDAYSYALDTYEKLPESHNPFLIGKKQAIEVFFQIIGINPEELNVCKDKHKSFREIIIEKEAKVPITTGY